MATPLRVRRSLAFSALVGQVRLARECVASSLVNPPLELLEVPRSQYAVFTGLRRGGFFLKSQVYRKGRGITLRPFFLPLFTNVLEVRFSEVRIPDSGC